jgi:hypothetical protein
MILSWVRILGPDSGTGFWDRILGRDSGKSENGSRSLALWCMVSGMAKRSGGGRAVGGVGHATLPELFQAQALRTPDAVALTCAQQQLRYHQLNRRANQLAHWLIRHGAGPEQVVAVALPRSPELIVATLAVLKAGAACLPIDPAYPAERISYMLADAKPLLVLDDPDPIAAAQRPGLADTDPTDADRGAPLTPQSAAYVIYTSGSTGRPKGVVVTHQGIPSLAATQRRRLAVTPTSRILQFSALGFDAYFWELCLALLSGARLVLAPADQLLVGAQLAELVAREKVTHLTLPPTVLAALPAEQTLPEGITLIVAGEPCPAALVERWAPGRRMLNAYGPTEATVCVSISDPLPDGPTPQSAAPPTTPASTCSTPPCNPSPPPPPATSTSPAPPWPAATSTNPPAPPNTSSPTPTAHPANACTTPATWPAGAPTANSNSSAATTTKSNSAASASNWARSPPPCKPTPTSPPPRPWSATTTTTPAWSPTPPPTPATSSTPPRCTTTWPAPCPPTCSQPRSSACPACH